jgi:hypothetical protein
MSHKQDVMTVARNYLRDFPKFFQISFEPAGRTYDVGKPNLDVASLWVAFVPSGAGGASATTIPATDYAVDVRGGLIRLNDPLGAVDRVMIEGYYYEWLTPDDLSFYADMAIRLNTHNLKIHLEDMAPAVVDVVGIHALIQALWGLLGEFSRDIDVITSESVHIIASQRYRMVSSLLDYWMAEYNKRAAALNIGLERMEIMNLRRVSRTTNRYVPLYKAREVGDYSPIERLWPEIEEGLVRLEEPSDDLREDVYTDGEPPPGYLTTGYF